MTNVPVPNLPINVYGVPWIIGAKKGFPNFNEFVGENIVGMTRRLQVTRIPNTSTVTGTNQMYMMSLNTSGGLDFWNSYSNNFMDPLIVDYRVITWLSLTNSDSSGYLGGNVPLDPPPQYTAPLMAFSASNSIPFTGWSGTGPWENGAPNPNSFYVPLSFTNYVNLSNSVYRTPDAGETAGTLPSGATAPSLIWTNYFNLAGQPMTAVYETNPADAYQNGQAFYVPQWGLLTTNQVQVYILDRDPSGTYFHVVDYVHLEQSSGTNLNNEIFSDDNSGVWNTNIDTKYGIPYGVYNQLLISEGLENVNRPKTASGSQTSKPRRIALRYRCSRLIFRRFSILTARPHTFKTATVRPTGQIMMRPPKPPIRPPVTPSDIRSSKPTIR